MSDNRGESSNQVHPEPGGGGQNQTSDQTAIVDPLHTEGDENEVNDTELTALLHSIAQNQTESDQPDVDSSEAQPDVVVDPGYVQSQLYTSTGDEHDHGNLLDPFSNDLGDDGFDPDTLANLAALSRIDREDDDDEVHDEGDVEPAVQEVQEPELSRDQVRALVEGLRGKRTEQRESEDEDDKNENENDEKENDVSGDDEDKPEADDEEYKEHKDDKDDKDEKGRKRRRNRTVLSCTECHRRCDRNIPCNRCIKRGVPGMCRMEFPNMPQQKRRRKNKPMPINRELGLRVKALETLIKAGSNMDSESANAAALETIMHATRAAEAGNVDASSALASLTSAAGTNLAGISLQEQSGLLMEVLQQLSSASMSRKHQEEDIPEETDDPWSTVPEAAIEALQRADDTPSESTIDLTVPGFREDDGRIFIPPTVRHVDKGMRTENLISREPLPIQGDALFLTEGTRFAYGADSAACKKNLVASIQSSSLTGALRIASAFLSRFPQPSTSRTIYVPDPASWQDESAIKASGMVARSLRFADPRGLGVDWEGMREDLLSAEPGSAVLLYLGGSMPAGTELTSSQWRLLTLILLERQLIPLCILAFQGLASGDPAKDAQPMRFMVHEGLPLVLVQSFDATMGIYADSPSIVSLVTQSQEVKARVESQFRTIAQTLHSHPSPWGAHVARVILTDAKMHPAWLNEIKAMSHRLRSVRDRLHDLLVNRLKTPGNWYHIKRAAGMYCSTLLAPNQVRALATHKNIHLFPDGSFSLGNLNSPRTDALARAIDWITRESIRQIEESQAQARAMEQALTAAREAAAKLQAEAAARAVKEAEERARADDAALMEKSIADALDAQLRAEEDEKRKERERREMDEAIKKAQERADIQRRAEEILASIGT